MKLLARVPFLLLVIALAGCSTRIASTPLETHCVTDKGAGNPDRCSSPRGIIYHLPAKQLTYKMDLELVSCSKPLVNITSISVTEETKRDPHPSARFVIDVDDMTAFNKVIKDASIQLKNGLLTSITYEAEDQTAEIIKEGTKFLTTTLSSRLGPSELKETQEGENNFCNQATYEATKNRNAPENKVRLTITVQASVMPLTLNSPQRIDFDLSPSLKWFDLTKIGNRPALLSDLAKFEVRVRECHGIKTDYWNDAEPGLYYRDPDDCLVELRLRSKPIISATYEMPQFGTLARLQIENKVFQNNKHEVKFSEASGGITQFQVKDIGDQSPGLKALTNANAMQVEILGHQKSVIDAQKELLESQQALIETQSASGK